MTNDQYVAILQRIANLSKSVAAASDGVTDIEAASQAVSAAVANLLPAKADGTAFTDAELHAAAMAAMTGYDNVINRDGQ